MHWIREIFEQQTSVFAFALIMIPETHRFPDIQHCFVHTAC